MPQSAQAGLTPLTYPADCAPHGINGQGTYFCIDKAVSLKRHVYGKLNAGCTAQEGYLTDGSLTALCQPRLYFCSARFGFLKPT